MSVQKKLKTAAFLLLVASIGIAAASEPHQYQTIEGTRGGGEFVKRRGYVELRDLLDKTTCDWSSDGQILAEYPEIDEVLGKIAGLDWYLALLLRQEIRAIDWCFTGKLIKVNTRDRDALTVSVVEESEQVAIRMLDSREAYVNRDLLNRASHRATRAYTILHEAAHSFLDLDEPQRNTKLRSVIKSLFRAANGQIKSRKKLYDQLRNNGIRIRIDTDALDRYRLLIEYLLGSSEERFAILSRVQDIELFFEQAAAIPRFAPGLAQAHQSQISSVTFDSLIQELCADGRTRFVESLFRKPEVKASTWTSCMSAASADPTLRGFLVAQRGFSSGIRDLLERLSRKTFTVRDYRLAVSEVVQALSADSRRNIPFVTFASLTPVPKSGQSTFNELGEAFYGYVKTLVENEAWDAIDREISRNEAFYGAFSFDSLKSQLVMLGDLPIAREKQVAAAMLDEIPRNFWAAFLARLERDLGTERAAQFNAFKSKIDFGRLGLGI